MSFATISVHTLPNGLRVVLDPVGHVATVALGVWVFTGGRHEEPSVLGISHLLEHMAFKGTKRRSARAIVEEIEAVGGYLNAYTSREQTVYHARTLAPDVPLALDILADILTQSTFDADELEREREVIIQEIGQAADDPEDYVFDLLQEAAFGDQPLGRPILGTVETVGAIPREALSGHLARHYRPDRMIVVLSGRIDPQAALAEAEARFGGIATAGPALVQPAAERFHGGEKLLARDFEQAHLTLALPGVGHHDPDYQAVQVLAELYGGGMSSRLFQEAREVRGLCYTVNAFHSGYADTGLFAFYAGTSEEDAAELYAVALGELADLAKGPKRDETERAKAQVRASILMGLESLHARCEWIARYLARYGRVPEPEEIIARIDAIEPGDLGRLATGLMSHARPAVAALGPVSGLANSGSITAHFGAAASGR